MACETHAKICQRARRYIARSCCPSQAVNLSFLAHVARAIPQLGGVAVVGREMDGCEAHRADWQGGG